MIWKAGDRVLDLTHSGQIMGILNVTPDSFADGGEYLDHQKAFEHAAEMVRQGAAIIDVGGESSRPGSDPVPLEEELQRIMPLLQRIRTAFREVLLSVDTYKAETARQAIMAGADIVNDITAARGDPDMLKVLKNSNAGVILMHMKGMPKTMQINPQYGNVVAEVASFLQERLEALVRNNIDPSRIAIDPGYGFGKRLSHNLELVRQLDHIGVLARPLVVGISKKSMIAQLLGNPKLSFEERAWPSVALTCLLREKGARVFRVHDVQPNLEALRMIEAILIDEQSGNRIFAE